MRTKDCETLIEAFRKKQHFPEGDVRRTGPLTPNGPATIVSLASELMGARAQLRRLVNTRKAHVRARYPKDFERWSETIYGKAEEWLDGTPEVRRFEQQSEGGQDAIGRNRTCWDER